MALLHAQRAQAGQRCEAAPCCARRGLVPTRANVCEIWTGELWHVGRKQLQQACGPLTAGASNALTLRPGKCQSSVKPPSKLRAAAAGAVAAGACRLGGSAVRRASATTAVHSPRSTCAASCAGQRPDHPRVTRLKRSCRSALRSAMLAAAAITSCGAACSTNVR